METEKKKKSSTKTSTESTKKTTRTSTSNAVLSTGIDAKLIEGWGDQDKKIIIYWSFDKIGAFKGKQNNELAATIATIQDFIGVKHDDHLEGRMEDKMIEHLKEHYGDFSLKELDYAFSLAAVRKLEGLNYEYRENLPFNGFNAIYAGAILDAYRKQRSKAILRYQQAQDAAMEPIIREAEKPKEDQESLTRRHTLTCWSLYKDGTPFGRADAAYDYLISKGLAKFPEARMKTFREYAETAIKIRKEPHMRGQTKKAGDLILGMGDLAEKAHAAALETETKKVALITYFRGLIDMQVDLGDLLNQEET